MECGPTTKEDIMEDAIVGALHYEFTITLYTQCLHKSSSTVKNPIIVKFIRVYFSTQLVCDTAIVYGNENLRAKIYTKIAFLSHDDFYFRSYLLCQ